MSDLDAKAQKKLERQKKKKRLKQEQLIDIAESLFIKLGYENTTLEMIAEEVGYTKRSLYLYFRDKEDIFSAVVLRALNTQLELMKEAVTNKETGFSKLIALAEAYYAYYVNYPWYFEFNRIFEVKTYYYHKPVEEKETGHFAIECQKKNDEITDLLKTVIERGIKDGTITSKLKVMNLLLILWGTAFGMIQILSIRKKNLTDIYKTNEEELFNDFIASISKIVKK